ncbi:MAG: Bax inhibitor-1 family protein, partial [Deltaproteobacteria bacterium]|nr:Bax inhibitor-1 family protein [Deltaproteobacteria bacterium]
MAQVSVTRPTTQVMVNEFVRSVYNWMFVGLALTGFVAYYVSTSQAALQFVFGNRLVFFGIILAELALVFSISGLVHRMSGTTATALFVIYSALNGV